MTYMARIEALRARGAHITLTDDTPYPDFATMANGRVLACIGKGTGPLRFTIYNGDEDTANAMLDIVDYQLADRSFRCSCRPYCECPSRPDFPSAHHARSRGNGEADFYTRVPLSRVGAFLETMLERSGVNSLDAFGCDAVEAGAVLKCHRSAVVSDRRIELTVRGAQLDLAIEGMREELRTLTALHNQQIAA